MVTDSSVAGRKAVLSKSTDSSHHLTLIYASKNADCV